MEKNYQIERSRTALTSYDQALKLAADNGYNEMTAPAIADLIDKGLTPSQLEDLLEIAVPMFSDNQGREVRTRFFLKAVSDVYGNDLGAFNSPDTYQEFLSELDEAIYLKSENRGVSYADAMLLTSEIGAERSRNLLEDFEFNDNSEERTWRQYKARVWNAVNAVREGEATGHLAESVRDLNNGRIPSEYFEYQED